MIDMEDLMIDYTNQTNIDLAKIKWQPTVSFIEPNFNQISRLIF